MALTKFEQDLNIIAKLDDEPNDVGGLSAAELKAKFDEGGLTLQKYINEVLIPVLEDLLDSLDKNKAGKEELQGVVLGQIPDGTITSEKLADETIAKEKLNTALQEEIGSHATKAEHNAHISATNNPHKVTAAQVAVSEDLAAQFDMPVPSFAEEVLAALGSGLQGLYDSVEGTAEAGTRWRMYEWALGYTSGKSVATSGTVAKFTLEVADSVSIGSDGSLSLNDPTTITYTDALPEVGKYFRATKQNTDIMLVTDGSYREMAYDLESNTNEVTFRNLSAVWTYERYIGDITDTSPDAYPEDGWADGVHYIRAGLAAGKIAQIQTGHYAGTGVYGGENPTGITLHFVPKAVFVMRDDQAAPSSACLLWLGQAGSSTDAQFTLTDKTLSWYAASAENQLNSSGHTYYYLAIG